MKDKEKQIEEMAKAICSHCLEMTEEKVCPYAKTEDEVGNEACFTERLHEAEKVYNAGYRKLPEDSVVLSTEELKDMVKARTKCVENAITRTRKETAKKIFNKLWYVIKKHCGYEEVLDKDDLKCYAKQFGVEIKE